MLQNKSIILAPVALLTLSAGCTHTQIWESQDYVAPGSVEYGRLEGRLARLYVGPCKLKDNTLPFIINGKRVVLVVPRTRDCERAIPYAVCEATATESAAERCKVVLER